MIFYKYTFMQNGSLYFPAEDAGLQSLLVTTFLFLSLFSIGFPRPFLGDETGRESLISV